MVADKYSSENIIIGFSSTKKIQAFGEKEVISHFRVDL